MLNEYDRKSNGYKNNHAASEFFLLNIGAYHFFPSLKGIFLAKCNHLVL